MVSRLRGQEQFTGLGACEICDALGIKVAHYQCFADLLSAGIQAGDLKIVGRRTAVPALEITRHLLGTDV